MKNSTTSKRISKQSNHSISIRQLMSKLIFLHAIQDLIHILMMILFFPILLEIPLKVVFRVLKNLNTLLVSVLLVIVYQILSVIVLVLRSQMGRMGLAPVRITVVNQLIPKVHTVMIVRLNFLISICHKSMGLILTRSNNFRRCCWIMAISTKCMKQQKSSLILTVSIKVKGKLFRIFLFDKFRRILLIPVKIRQQVLSQSVKLIQLNLPGRYKLWLKNPPVENQKCF